MRAIDADALTQLLQTCADDNWNKNTSAGTWSNAYEEMILHVEDMPTIEPERKPGRWIKDKKSSPAKAGLSNYLCDQCGECGGTWRSDLKPHQFPKFCMWCGAKMKMEAKHGSIEN